MNPLTLIKAAPYVIVAFFVLSLSVVTNLYVKKRDELVSFKASVAAIGEQAKKEKEAIEKKHSETLEALRTDYEKRIPAIRSGAVATYKLRFSNSGSRTVCGPSTSDPVDDGTKSEWVPVQPGFIQECASDSAKVGAWQAYCFQNRCPVKE